MLQFSRTKKWQSVLNTSSLSIGSGGVPGDDPEHEEPEAEHLLEIFSDSDWAGDKATRRSVSCACMFLNGNFFIPTAECRSP